MSEETKTISNQQEKPDFSLLSLDHQRTLIEKCIANKQISVNIDGVVYGLPNMLQYTYKCSNVDCNEVMTARFFRTTVLSGGISSTIKCPMCKHKMYVAYKTAALTHLLGEQKKKNEEGLFKYLSSFVVAEKETYGPPPQD